jgi:hypothetical protein
MDSCVALAHMQQIIICSVLDVYNAREAVVVGHGLERMVHVAGALDQRKERPRLVDEIDQPAVSSAPFSAAARDRAVEPPPAYRVRVARRMLVRARCSGRGGPASGRAAMRTRFLCGVSAGDGAALLPFPFRALGGISSPSSSDAESKSSGSASSWVMYSSRVTAKTAHDMSNPWSLCGCTKQGAIRFANDPGQKPAARYGLEQADILHGRDVCTLVNRLDSLAPQVLLRCCARAPRDLRSISASCTHARTPLHGAP